MATLIQLLDIFYGGKCWDEARLAYVKREGIDKVKEFLAWLIETDHIEKIGEGEINDYLRYIATTEDPIQTLISLLK